RNHVQTVRAFVERLPFDGDRISKRNGGVFVSSGTPHLPVRGDLAPKLSTTGQRPVIVNGDVCDSDTLRDLSVLALAGQVEHQSFARGGLSMAHATNRQEKRQQSEHTDSMHGKAPYLAEIEHKTPRIPGIESWD